MQSLKKIHAWAQMQVPLSNTCNQNVVFSLKIVFALANSVDLDEKLYYAAFHLSLHCQQLFLFACFVALRPKSTAMVMAGWSVHLKTLFPGQA